MFGVIGDMLPRDRGVFKFDRDFVLVGVITNERCRGVTVTRGLEFGEKLNEERR